MGLETLRLRLLPGRLAVWRLEPHQQPPSLPPVSARDGLWSITRTGAEISVVCDEMALPEDAVAERGMRALMVLGPLDFGLVGIVAGLSRVLAAAEIPIFVVSTYDTDYLLFRDRFCDRALRALGDAGYEIS